VSHLRHRDARTRKTRRFQLEILEGRNAPSGVSASQALVQGMTSPGVRSSEQMRVNVGEPPVIIDQRAEPIRLGAEPIRPAIANPIIRTKFVTAGDWTTLETYWHTNATLFFQGPAGAQIKVRVGGGWIFGYDSQKQTLDGSHIKTLSISKFASTLVERVQIKVPASTFVTYSEAREGPLPFPHPVG
jgi:hypothetical protein